MNLSSIVIDNNQQNKIQKSDSIEKMKNEESDIDETTSQTQSESKLLFLFLFSLFFLF